jgi:hypothetical protein
MRMQEQRTTPRTSPRLFESVARVLKIRSERLGKLLVKWDFSFFRANRLSTSYRDQRILAKLAGDTSDFGCHDESSVGEPVKCNRPLPWRAEGPAYCNTERGISK